MYYIFAALELVQYGLRLLGIAASTVGSLTVIYPDLEHPSIKRLIRRAAPGIKTIEDARDDYYSPGDVTDDDYVQIIEEMFEARYRSTDKDQPPEKVTSTTTGPRLEYVDGTRVLSPFNRPEAADIELQLLFSDGLRRYCRQRGMWFIAIGFATLFIGTL